ncbi:MAG: DUF3990 domain-containing protein [Bacteroidales bacterium]|nr:DUF3990 domain-containing protein [Bacteroidales bacterium]
MRLFHGTNAIIEEIDLDQNRVGKNFGIGFYLTPVYDILEQELETKKQEHKEEE